jgi:hypothetical protein
MGISPQARVEILPVKDGLKIWDLESENQHILGLSGETLSSVQKPLPRALKALLTESDDSLKERLSDRRLRKWSDERETILSELKYRGINAEAAASPAAKSDQWNRRTKGFPQWLDLSRFWQRIGLRDTPQ